jgi:hypothetical protein
MEATTDSRFCPIKDWVGAKLVQPVVAHKNMERAVFFMRSSLIKTSVESIFLNVAKKKTTTLSSDGFSFDLV